MEIKAAHCTTKSTCRCSAWESRNVEFGDFKEEGGNVKPQSPRQLATSLLVRRVEEVAGKVDPIGDYKTFRQRQSAVRSSEF